MKLFPLGLYKVRGKSMEPGLPAGSVVAGWKWFRPKVDDVVVINREHPLIKRVVDIRRGEIWAEGDNKQVSTDSRHFGHIKPSDLEAKVIKRLF